MAEVPVQPQPTTKGINWRKIVLTVVMISVVFGLVGGSLWWYVQSQASNTSSETVSPQKENTEEKNSKTACELNNSENNIIKDWNTYTNTTYNFSFRYPADWKVKEETKDTVTLQSDKPDVEFVLYKSDIVITGIKPYKILSTEKVTVLCKETEKSLLEDDSTVFPTAPRPSRDGGAFVQIEEAKTRFVISIFYKNEDTSTDQSFDLILKTLNFE
jgi:hypothetical protein